MRIPLRFLALAALWSLGAIAVDAAAAAAAVEAGSTLRASVSAAGGARYIVQLSDAPLVAYRGGLPGLAATAPVQKVQDAWSATARPRVAGDDAAFARVRPDLFSPASFDYRAHLRQRQAAAEQAIQAIAPQARALYHYDVAFNGLTLRLSAAEAERVRALPGVLAVTAEERVVPLMDASLPVIGAPAAWTDPRVGGRSGGGRGVRIAVIDSGISAAHPMYADDGFVPPAGFPQASWTVGDAVTAYGAEDLARYTNDKVIVARTYANPEVYDPATPLTPLADGIGGFHGGHVAGTAAGSIVKGAPGLKSGSIELSGVAPGAYLMAYKFTDAYTPEILRMIDDAVADGADVINNSWGTSAMNVMDPDLHPVSQAFKAAQGAGVVVVAAAGNAGTNGEATLGGPHQMIDEVITVANSQTGRGFAYYLYAADAGLAEDLQKHPAAYEAFGNDFTVIEKPAVRLADFCNVLGLAINARNKVILEPASGTCDIPGLPIGNLPIPEQFGFLTKLLLAGVTNGTAGGFGGTPVESIVFYAPDGDPAQLAAALGLLDQISPFLGQLGLTVKFPVVAMITGPKAVELAAWADGHKSLKLKLDGTPATVNDPALLDQAHPTSSQGPSPSGSLKPDLAAPGTDILSANTGADGAPDGYALATGTSMASPHVAGATALLRQAWPAWSPADIKAALMVTADPVVKVGLDAAPARVQGSGRLDLARAIDPGLLILPPAVGFDRARLLQRDAGLFVELRDVRRTGDESVVYAISHEPGDGLDAAMLFQIPADATATVPAGGTLRWRLPLSAAGGMPAPGDYDGRLVFRSPSHTVRLAYRFTVPGDREDVLLVNVRRTAAAGGGGIPGLPGGGAGLSDGPDYEPYWTAALQAAGLSYDVWTVAAGAKPGAPPVRTLQDYDLVILAAGDGNAPLDQLAGGMTSLQMFLLGGGHMLISGWNYNHDPAGGLGAINIQGSGAMYFLSRYFAGFERTTNDVAPAGAIAPVRLFDAPLRLATSPGPNAAGNGGKIDLGRPLAALVTRVDGGGGGVPGGGATAPDLGIAAPSVVTRLMPYMRSYLEVDGGGAAVTGVNADATLEAPQRAAFIGWRALFAGFGVEAISGEAGSMDRAAFLRAVHAWAVESDAVELRLSGPDEVEAGKGLTLTAEARLPEGVTVTGWRWDRGDGSGYVASQQPVLSLRYTKGGDITARVELTTTAGHTYVAEHRLTVRGGPGTIHLPFLLSSPRRR